MIRPPGMRGTAFSSPNDGDMRAATANRTRFSRGLGISDRWATARQVHGSEVLEAEAAGSLGDGDGLFTSTVGLPLAVFVADCVPVVLEADGAVGVAHAGWRGLAAGVVTATRERMIGRGFVPLRAAIGPSIGPCCYEVGHDVSQRLAGFRAETTWGTSSVDLWSAAEAQLEGMEVIRTDLCTMHTGSFSHRRSATSDRLAAVAWHQ